MSEDIGGHIYQLLSQASSATDHAALFEASFTEVAKLKALPVQERLAASWRIAELGGLKIIVSFIQPSSPAIALALTLLGVMTTDVNVLSHKLGALVIANDGFLSAINTHLKPVEGSRMPMLASQVLNNIVKSADRSTIVKIMEFGHIAQLLVDVVGPFTVAEIKDDWRHGFVAVELLLSFQIACLEEATKRGISDVIARLLAARASQLPKLHRAYFQRCVASCLWWFAQQDTRVDSIHTEVLQALKIMEQQEDGPVSGVLVKLLETKDKSVAAEALSIIGQRVRDWEEIEKQAQEFVRSPNFRGASEAPGITEVTDSKGDDKVEKAKENTKAQELKTDGNACFQLKRYEQAVEKYTEALASSPDSELEATLYSNRAESLLRLEKFEDAQADCERALALTPTAIKAMLRRAKAQVGLDQPDSATVTLDKLLAIDANNKAAKDLLAKIKSK